MKILISLIICSSVAQECMPPFQWPETFRTKYDCSYILVYEESKKLEEIGREDINKYGMYIKFTCTPVEHDLTMWLNYGSGKNLLTITYPYFSLFRVGV